MLLKEIFRNVRSLENQGVVTVENEATLIYELETFVCAGKYNDGLLTILETFINNVDKKVQQGIWVSGFYGSGKSHLIKILCSLWGDQKFADGKSARGIAHLSDEVKAELLSLSQRAKSEGGLYSAIGKLGAGIDNPRLALLSIIFKSKGLPSEYHLADFVLHLKECGKLDEVREKVGDFEHELTQFYVSRKLAKALEEAMPEEFSGKTSEILIQQYRNRTDSNIEIDDMVEMIKRVISVDGKLPLGLIGLDEVQQYIGSNADRALEVQNIVEAISNSFNGKLILVATGQTAITSHDDLKRVKDRFQIPIQLSDADVDRVVRDIVLSKDASKKPEIERMVDRYNGEITRQLKGTPLWNGDKNEDIVNDYPLLPTRRRFWEQCLRAIDESGGSSQLRSQLKTVHSAVQKSLDKELGYIIPGDFIYFDWASDMTRNAGLTRDVYKEIEKLSSSSSEDNKLLGRACALIFLIETISTRQQSTSKLKATLDTVTDLLVDNLSSDTALIKGKLKTLLSNCQIIDDLGNDEYKIRTEEGKALAAALSKSLSSVRTEEVHFRRDEIIEEIVRKEANVTIQQGKSRVNRQVKAYFGDEEPVEGDRIGAWVRSGWAVDYEQFEKDAKAPGTSCPTIHIFLPKEKENELYGAIKEALASQKVLNSGIASLSDPHSRRGIENKLESAKKTAERIIQDSISQSRVLLSGGEVVSPQSNLKDKIITAAQSSVKRLYSKFDLADYENWEKVYNETTKLNTSALAAIGFHASPLEHKAVREVLDMITYATSGKQIYDKFLSPPYGWSTDAVDSILSLLLLLENVEAKDETNKLVTKVGSRKTLRSLKYEKNELPISEEQKMNVRGLLRSVKIETNDLTDGIVKLVDLLSDLQESSGGEPPLPPKAEICLIDELKKKNTKERIHYLNENLKEIKDSISRLNKLKDRISSSRVVWDNITYLLETARNHEGIEAFKQSAEIIKKNRQLIDDSNYVETLFRDLTDWLREEILKIKGEYTKAYVENMGKLEGNSKWTELRDEDKKDSLKAINGIDLFSDDISDGDKVFAFLKKTSFRDLKDKIFALKGRFNSLIESLMEKPEPGIRVYKVSDTTIKDAKQLEEWILTTREAVMKALEEGPVIIK